MADISHVLTLSWARNGESISQSVTISDNGELNRNVTVANGATDFPVAATIDVSEIKSLYIHSTQNVTIETNSGGSPANTLTVTANKPLVWYVGCGLTNPLSTDVTGLFITNASGSSADVKIRIIVDTA